MRLADYWLTIIFSLLMHCLGSLSHQAPSAFSPLGLHKRAGRPTAVIAAVRQQTGDCATHACYSGYGTRNVSGSPTGYCTNHACSSGHATRSVSAFGTARASLTFSKSKITLSSTKPDPAATLDASIIEECNRGDLSNPNPKQWQKYKVDDWYKNYRATVLTATPLPISYVTAITYNRDAAGLVCTADSGLQCGSGIDDCFDWLLSTPFKNQKGQADTARAYIFYRGYGNFGGLVSTIALSTNFGASQLTAEIPSIGTHYLSEPAPDKSWDRYMAGIGPAMGALGGLFGIAGIGRASGAFSGFGNMLGSMAQTYYVSNAVAGDYRIDAIGDLSGSFSALWHLINMAMTDAFTKIVTYDNGTDAQVAPLAKILKDGHFLAESIAVTADNATITRAVQEGTMKFFEYASVNAIWRAQDVFAVFVPYNHKIVYSSRSKGGGREYDPFLPKHCKDILAERDYPTGSCEGEGMTFLISDPFAPLFFPEVAPAGAEAPVPLVNGNLTWQQIMKSSVGGWLNQGFDANVSNPIFQALAGDVTESFKDVNIAQLQVFNEIGPEVDGWRVTDNLPGTQNPHSYFDCPCNSDAANSPANPKQKFRNFVSEKLMKKMSVSWGEDCYQGK